MDKTPVLAKHLANIVFRGNSVSPVRLKVGQMVEKRCSSERKSHCISRNNSKTKQPARRTLEFDSFSPPQKRRVLPSILIDGIKIDFNSTTAEPTHEIPTISSPIGRSTILYNGIPKTGSLIGTPKLNTPEKQAILEKGNLKFWPVIGEGSFGTVIKTKYKGQRVAVKIVSKSSSPKKESLLRERHALQLNHPNIIKMISVINYPHTKFGMVIMELWNSIDLQRVLDDSERQLTFLQKVCCSLDICQALNHCHERKILHLDVKPKNVLIHMLGWPSKICDFGSSISIADIDCYKYFPRHQGTIKYMAPELFKGSNITEKADVYSLGITMWQLLNEETPYMGEDLHTIIYKVVSQNYRPSSSKFHSIEKKFVTVYETCWLEDYKFRPTTAEVANSLAVILEANKIKNDVRMR